jgi:hypothetical protein
MTKAADLALGKIAAVKTALIEFTDGDDAIAVADAGVVTLLTTAVAKSEGGAVTTNIAQGLAKFWVRWNGTGTAAENDAFNSSGLTDNGTGQTTFGFSSNMNNANFSLATTNSSVEANNSQTNFEEATTSTIKMGTRNGGGSLTDTSLNFGQICGDLA